MATQRGATAQAETGLTNSQIEQGAAEGRLGRQPTEQAIEDARVQRARVEAERARDRQGTAEDIADARLEHEYDSLDDEFAIKDAQAEAARLQAEGIIATHRAGGPIIQDPSGFRQAAGAALMEIAAPIDAGDTGQATYDQIPTKQINYFVNVHMASLREAYQSGDAQQKRIAIETARELMSLAPETEPDGDIRLRRTFWGFVRDAVLPYGGEKRRDEAGYYNPERSGMARSREATQMLISAMDELEAIAAGEPLTQP